METAEGMALLFSNGVFTFQAPVLQINDKYMTTEQTFKGIDICE